MTASTIPDVKTALKDAFTGAAGLSGVAIAWGQQVPPQEEMVEIGLRSEAEREFAGKGPQPTPLYEHPQITIVVSVLRSPIKEVPQWEAAEKRMWELVEACEDVYRADLTLGSIVGWGLFENIKQEMWTFDRKHGSRAFITLAAKQAKLN